MVTMDGGTKSKWMGQLPENKISGWANSSLEIVLPLNTFYTYLNIIYPACLSKSGAPPP